jgi:S1-C subfamily serine protease
VLKQWEEASRKPEYENSLSHLAVRTAFEEAERSEEIAFLGVVKDQTFYDNGGAHVERAWPDSGAEKGGVRAGDVIVEIDGRQVDGWDDLVYGIRRGREGQKILLKVLRDVGEVELEVVLSKRP